MSKTSRRALGEYEGSYSPRVLRLVCLIAGLILSTGMAIILWQSPGQPDGFDRGNTVGLLLILAIFLTILWRFARARVDLYSDGISIHNFFRDYDVSWAQVFKLSYSPDDAWAYAELIGPKRITLLALARSEGESSARFLLRCEESLRAYEQRHDKD
ncbi:hypothetical protein [Timonella senegalensis]|uniref:hypothetical protein n=1 Tax=Timonella senegalensis TaxID=1465825 RepID=UPI002FDEDC43